MNRCPKCGSHRISGPRYQRASDYSYQPEGLRYRCDECGYSELKPCNDSKRAAQAERMGRLGAAR